MIRISDKRKLSGLGDFIYVDGKMLEIPAGADPKIALQQYQAQQAQITSAAAPTATTTNWLDTILGVAKTGFEIYQSIQSMRNQDQISRDQAQALQQQLSQQYSQTANQDLLRAMALLQEVEREKAAEEEKTSPWLYIGIGGGALIVIMLMMVVLMKK